MEAVVVATTWQHPSAADALAAASDALRAAGVDPVATTDLLPPASAAHAYLLVPEQVMTTLEPDGLPTPHQLARTVALVVAPPQDAAALDRAALIGPSCATTFALHPGTVAALRRRGLGGVRHLPLVPTPAHAPAPLAGRDLDVVVAGPYSDRRARAVARATAVLAPRETAIHLEPTEPQRRALGAPVAGPGLDALLARTATRLLVHPDEDGHLDWFAAAQALAHGAVLVAERSRALGPLGAEHAIWSSWESLPDVLAAALADPEALGARRAATDDLLAGALAPRHAGALLAEALGAAADRPDALRRAGDAPPRPRPRAPRPADPFEARAAARDPRAMALDLLVRDVRMLRREVRDLGRGGAAGPAVEEDVVVPHGAHAGLEPEVSVLLCVHDDAEVVGEALRSVAATEHPALEVVVVDDASTDDSVEVVAGLLDELGLPALHVRRVRNGGLAAARNVALRYARAGRCFVLDADNAVLPNGIARLQAALAADPEAAFAYGILEVFDERGVKGLASWPAFTAGGLRHGNYIDAMALVRRADVLAVGGYPEEEAFRTGLEDLALWLALVEAGHHGVQVPQLVARYRSSVHSLVALAQIDESIAWAALVRRSPGALVSPGDA